LTTLLISALGQTNFTLESVSPLIGHTGTLVTIIGTGFDDVDNVALAPYDTDNYDFNDGGTNNVTVSNNGTEITVVSNLLKLGRCGSVVLYEGSTVLGNYTNESTPFCYTDTEMKISFVKPDKGQAGSRVTIFGTFAPDAAGAENTTTVIMAGIEVASIVSQSAEEIIVIAGNGSAPDEGGFKVIADTGAFAETEDDSTKVFEYVTLYLGVRVHWCFLGGGRGGRGVAGGGGWFNDGIRSRLHPLSLHNTRTFLHPT
jgi:hypothetical protein